MSLNDHRRSVWVTISLVLLLLLGGWLIKRIVDRSQCCEDPAADLGVTAPADG